MGAAEAVRAAAEETWTAVAVRQEREVTVATVAGVAAVVAQVAEGARVAWGAAAVA